MVRRLALIASVASFFTVFAGVAYATHSWGSYHWARTRNPFTLKLGDNVSAVWDPYLAEASSDWSASSVLDTSIVAVQGGKNCRGTTGRIEVCAKTYGSTGWLGLAQIWINSSSHITKAVAKMNDTYFNTATYNTPAWRRLVVCQEIAHDFGLDHQDETFGSPNLGSCMDYTSDPDGPPSNEHPNAHDFEQLELIYSHLDSTTTVSAAALRRSRRHLLGDLLRRDGSEPPDVDVSEPHQWGRVLHRDPKGRADIYERDLGGGHKVLTRLINTLEE